MADSWIDPGGGDFNDNLNWQDGTAPLTTDTAEFDLGAGPYTVTLTQNQTVLSLTVHNDNVEFDLGGFTLNATNTSGFTAGFNQNDAANVLFTNGTLNSPNAQIGRVDSVSTSVTASGSAFHWTTQTVFIGSQFNSNNAVTIEDGATATMNSWTIGNIQLGTAALTVTGAGSQLVGSSILMGLNGASGDVTIADGGLIQTSLQTRVDPAATGTNTLTVTGLNSRLKGTGSSAIRVADSFSSGSATLAIGQAGLVDYPDLEVAQAVGTTGIVTIGGALGGIDAKLNITDDAFIGRQSPSTFDNVDTGTAVVTVNTGGEFTVADDLFVGNSASNGSGTLNIAGGTLNARDLFIRPNGTFSFTAGQVNLAGQFTNQGELVIQGGTALDNPTLTSAGSFGSKVISGNLYIGGDSGGAGNPGTVRAWSNGFSTAGDTYVYAQGVLEIGSMVEDEIGTLVTNHLEADGLVHVYTNIFNGLTTQSLSITGTLDWQVGRIGVLGPQGFSTADIAGSSLVIPEFGVLDATASTTIESGETLENNGTINSNTLTIHGQLDLMVGSSINVNHVTNSGGTLNWNGGTIVLGTGGLHVGETSGPGVNHLGATLSIPDAQSLTVPGGVAIGQVGLTGTGSLTVGAAAALVTGGGHDTTIGSLGLVQLNTGQIDTRRLNLMFGAQLAGDGAVNAAVLADLGSSITATGDLDLGDATATNGFYSNGDLLVTTGTTTLNDANAAVFDSAAQVGLGNGLGGSATLSAPNGITLDFGANLTGFGDVSTPNDPFDPLINNGDINGNSALEPITLSGYVKGVGSLNNVVITGTDAPGFSPATVYRGSVGYAGTLEIELGGNGAGDFDRIIHTGTAALGGTLDVLLINGFVPRAGDSFDILDWGVLEGDFATLNLPALGGGLGWDTSALLIDGTLSVISTGLQGDLNADGFVGIADLNIVLGAWNQNVPPGDPQADPSGDGFVGIADLNLVLGNWNAGTPPASSVPEPATVAVLGALGVGVLLRPKAG